VSLLLRANQVSNLFLAGELSTLQEHRSVNPDPENTPPASRFAPFQKELELGESEQELLSLDHDTVLIDLLAPTGGGGAVSDGKYYKYSDSTPRLTFQPLVVVGPYDIGACLYSASVPAYGAAPRTDATDKTLCYPSMHFSGYTIRGVRFAHLPNHRHAMTSYKHMQTSLSDDVNENYSSPQANVLKAARY